MKTKKKQIIQVLLHDFIFSNTQEFKFDEDASLDKIAIEAKKRFRMWALAFRRYKITPAGRRCRDRGWIFFEGKVRTAEQVLSESNPREEILRKNIEYNKLEAVINTGGSVRPFRLSVDKVLKVLTK